MAKNGKNGANGVTVKRIVRKEIRKLPCKLTELEVAEAAQEAAEKDGDIATIEGNVETLKSQVKSENERKDRIEQERRALATLVRTGVEYREVEVVHEVADERSGQVQEVRQDTGEVLRERPMTREEAQAKLFNDLEHGVAGDEPEEERDVTPKGALPPKSLEWSTDTLGEFVIVSAGTYRIEDDGRGYTARWSPNVGRTKKLAVSVSLAEAKRLCNEHHLELMSDLFLEGNGSGGLVKKDLAGDAQKDKRQRGGRP